MVLPLPEPLGRHIARPRRGVAGIVLGTLAVTLGVLLLVLQALFPTQLERVVGEAQVAVASTVTDAVQEVSGTYPTITLGPPGGRREMNWCDGRFIEMESYRITDVLPVYAAHNNCGGAIILGWQIGDQVKIAGSDVLYEVVDERHTKKWGNIASLRGMHGELLVQTCFFGQTNMRFLGLQPVADAD